MTVYLMDYIFTFIVTFWPVPMNHFCHLVWKKCLTQSLLLLVIYRLLNTLTSTGPSIRLTSHLLHLKCHLLIINNYESVILERLFWALPLHMSILTLHNLIYMQLKQSLRDLWHTKIAMQSGKRGRSIVFRKIIIMSWNLIWKSPEMVSVREEGEGHSM